ncbi:oxidoreductase, zinc-binding dehydrogenase family protein, partial [Pseudomonas syringae pv. actinidiae ICMP 19100]
MSTERQTSKDAVSENALSTTPQRPAPAAQDATGSGGVSIFAAQIATALGANVIATSSKDENLQAVKALGAVAGVNYRTHPEWAEEVLKLTDGKGVDLLLDVAGGDGINQSIAATKAGGRIAQIGFLTGQTSALNLMPMIFRQTTFRGIAVAPRS